MEFFLFAQNCRLGPSSGQKRRVRSCGPRPGSRARGLMDRRHEPAPPLRSELETGGGVAPGQVQNLWLEFISSLSFLKPRESGFPGPLLARKSGYLPRAATGPEGESGVYLSPRPASTGAMPGSGPEAGLCSLAPF